jgi:hypothetical protein
MTDAAEETGIDHPCAQTGGTKEKEDLSPGGETITVDAIDGGVCVICAMIDATAEEAEETAGTEVAGRRGALIPSFLIGFLLMFALATWMQRCVVFCPHGFVCSLILSSLPFNLRGFLLEDMNWRYACKGVIVVVLLYCFIESLFDSNIFDLLA